MVPTSCFESSVIKKTLPSLLYFSHTILRNLGNLTCFASQFALHYTVVLLYIE
jgi:hypothetical protein